DHQQKAENRGNDQRSTNDLAPMCRRSTGFRALAAAPQSGEWQVRRAVYDHLTASIRRISRFRHGAEVALRVPAQIGETARGMQWREFSMKSWRILAWQHLSRELSCSLRQRSSVKRVQTA